MSASLAFQLARAVIHIVWSSTNASVGLLLSSPNMAWTNVKLGPFNRLMSTKIDWPKKGYHRDDLAVACDSQRQMEKPASFKDMRLKIGWQHTSPWFVNTMKLPNGHVFLRPKTKAPRKYSTSASCNMRDRQSRKESTRYPIFTKQTIF